MSHGLGAVPHVRHMLLYVLLLCFVFLLVLQTCLLSCIQNVEFDDFTARLAHVSIHSPASVSVRNSICDHSEDAISCTNFIFLLSIFFYLFFRYMAFCFTHAVSLILYYSL